MVSFQGVFPVGDGTLPLNGKRKRIWIDDSQILHEPSEYFQKVNFRYLFCCFFFFLFFLFFCDFVWFFVGFRPKHGLVPQILEFLYFIKMNIYGSCTERQRKVTSGAVEGTVLISWVCQEWIGKLFLCRSWEELKVGKKEPSTLASFMGFLISSFGFSFPLAFVFTTWFRLHIDYFIIYGHSSKWFCLWN